MEDDINSSNYAHLKRSCDVKNILTESAMKINIPENSKTSFNDIVMEQNIIDKGQLSPILIDTGDSTNVDNGNFIPNEPVVARDDFSTLLETYLKDDEKQTNNINTGQPLKVKNIPPAALSQNVPSDFQLPILQSPQDHAVRNDRFDLRRQLEEISHSQDRIFKAFCSVPKVGYACSEDEQVGEMISIMPDVDGLEDIYSDCLAFSSYLLATVSRWEEFIKIWNMRLLSFTSKHENQVSSIRKVLIGILLCT